MKITCATLLPLALLLAACSSAVTEKEKYSAFLANYNDITKGKSASGKDVLYWKDPDVDFSKYKYLVYQPMTYFPKPKPSEMVSQRALDNILNYTNRQFKQAMASHFVLQDIPRENTLIFRGAITAIDTQKKGLQLYEVLPITLLVAATQSVTGHRTMESAVYMEGEFIDAATQQPVIKVVRKASGENLNNEKSQLKVADVKNAIDIIATDIKEYNTL
ncbi:Protein of uncharacterised function (DUF3313) [Serratia entomophila]|uniref:DUF3313 domain-containing protein n=1 Tax=Serratia entomophila TaxID=42906 RepID=UPI00217B44F7|nr:DUF3313 domain-containing protein [Serratia entomophila]CAI1077150.1 Protein of uncharacterised function (DUF3313) [Serratia entomophila]CAI1809982.1 Protein of uncharacterised function (DUF3313) [Serratia entomophila]CAI1847774.1 Protein of uncharacterised function (DUF3313) [Serratia entomophila]CAI1930749.1 Protein of uncharacterised function (DUF3313) [Serratia entomophila]CAI2094795.1 Protein of uncharacterised function (DUF3313) [Serratia entomophila]